MIADKIKDCIVMNDASYFFLPSFVFFLAILPMQVSSLCAVTSSQENIWERSLSVMTSIRTSRLIECVISQRIDEKWWKTI